MMKFVITFLVIIMSISSYADYGLIDIENIPNNKEAEISVISKKEIARIKEKYQDVAEIQKVEDTFYLSLIDYLNQTNQKCELNLIHLFRSRLQAASLNTMKLNIDEYLKLLRVNNSIDGILYNLSTNINNDVNNLKRLETTRKIRGTKRNTKTSEDLLKNNELSFLFKNLKVWPNEKELCAYQEFYFIKTNLKSEKLGEKIKNKKSLKIMSRLMKEAYVQGLLTKDTYHRLEYLRTTSFVSKRKISLTKYLGIVMRAKDQMVTANDKYEIKDLSLEDDFSTERIRRFRKLTRREMLYQKYTPTQIIMMSQVLQKASRRMGVDPDVRASAPIVTQTFTYIDAEGNPEKDESGTVRTYVESHEFVKQDQYNLARKKLRKDMSDLQGMEIFAKKEIFYNEIVLAAFETGYLTIEDIAYAVRYDDLWNPTKTRKEKIVGFIFTMTGYASFFLPPPFNIVGGLVLTITEGVVRNKMKGGESNDHANTLIN